MIIDCPKIISWILEKGYCMFFDYIVWGIAIEMDVYK
jgi:hypothetical protein